VKAHTGPHDAEGGVGGFLRSVLDRIKIHIDL
jgi:hypothetical protein